MKGIELPINILVIVAVAIIVLLGVIALFYSSWFGGTQPVTGEQVKAQMCNIVSRTPNACSTLAPSSVSQQTEWKGYTNLEEFCIGEYGMAGGPWAAGSSEARQCFNMACGMQC